MFKKLFNKWNSLQEHHQTIFTLVVLISIICMSWSIEHILEDYIFPSRPLEGYLFIIAAAITLLLVTKHLILHVI